MSLPQTMERVSARELVELCAVDSILFCRTFFPEAFTQPFASMHEDMWAQLEDPAVERFACSAFPAAVEGPSGLTLVCIQSRTCLMISPGTGQVVRSWAATSAIHPPCRASGGYGRRAFMYCAKAA